MMESDHKCLRSLPRLIRRTCLCRATPLRRHPPVSFVQNLHHPRNLRNPQQRPSPAAPPPADPAAAPAPFLGAPNMEPATVQSVCRTGTPRPRTTTHARAAPSHPYIHSPAKSSPPLLPFSAFSVNSVFSVLNLFPRTFHFQLSTSGRLFSQQRNHLPPELHHTLQRPGRHPDNLFEQPRHGRQKLQHAFQPLARVRIASRVRFHLLHALRQHIQRRVDFPPLPLLGNDPENLPHVLDRLEVVAPVAQHVHHAHD